MGCGLVLHSHFSLIAGQQAFFGPPAAVRGARCWRVHRRLFTARIGRTRWWARERGPGLMGCARAARGGSVWRAHASRVADAAMVLTSQIVSRVQAANIFRLLLVMGLFPFLFSVCCTFQALPAISRAMRKRRPNPRTPRGFKSRKDARQPPREYGWDIPVRRPAPNRVRTETASYNLW